MPTNIPNTNYQVPSAGDDGESWAAVIEDFMERMAIHNHQDTNSQPLTISVDSLFELTPAPLTYTLDPIAGEYVSNVIDLAPDGYDLGSNRKFFYRDGTNYLEFFPTINVITNTTFTISTNEQLPDIKISFF